MRFLNSGWLPLVLAAAALGLAFWGLDHGWPAAAVEPLIALGGVLGFDGSATRCVSHLNAHERTEEIFYSLSWSWPRYATAFVLAVATIPFSPIADAPDIGLALLGIGYFGCILYVLIALRRAYRLAKESSDAGV